MTATASTTRCVTVTHTIQSGIVVCWYLDRCSLEHHQPVVSASRNGVMGHAGDYLTPELFAAAWDAHQRLAKGEGVPGLATHRRRGLTGPYEPVLQTPDRRSSRGAATSSRPEEESA